MRYYHSLKVEAVLEDLKSSPLGISREKAQRRLLKYGPNELPKEKPLGKLRIFFSQFNNAMIYILILTVVFSLVVRSYKEAGVIACAIIINVIIGFFQENKANQAITKLKQLVEHKAYAIRDGQEMLLASHELTIGDLIILKAGNWVPADARLIEAHNLQVDEASLTGESIPSNKTSEPVPKGAALADRENMVYAGTMVVNGLGRAVVTGIGLGTEIGRIAELVSSEKEEETPLQKRLGKFSRLLGLMFSVICVLIVTVGLLQGREFMEMLETGVAVGVASIPEGLTVAVTFLLALGMQQILKERALTRKLIAAETLGSITVICTDKTGTLTEGKMHVAHIIIGEKEFELDSAGMRNDEKEAKAVSLALQTGMMCNNAFIENPKEELKSWRIIGSPTEEALLSAAIQSGLRREELLKLEPLVDELPFDSDRKFMLSLHEKEDGGYVLYEKGAPERLLDKSIRFRHLGALVDLGEKEKKRLKSTYEALTMRGLRVIGVAIREIRAKDGLKYEKASVPWDEIDQDLTFIGFIAIKDPLRKEAKETISLCRQAGIRPVIITGDHKLTARAIAEDVGFKVKSGTIITGPELDEIDDDSFGRLIEKIDIYARVTPHHKLRIVKTLKARGEVVAMTGDGINDSPALKAADIGISLGTATDIAKETSDIVLLDDNFKTIISAIGQGRIIFTNIRKVITYLLSDSFSEMILIVGSIIFNTNLAVLPAQILWINIVNDSFPNFALAFERDHGDVMREKPARKDEPLLNKEMRVIIFGVGIIRDLVLFALFYFMWREWRGSSELMAYLATLIFFTLGVKSLLGIFSIRSFTLPIWKYSPFSNRYLLAAVSASFIFLLIGVYWPPLQSLLGTVSLDLYGWLFAFGFGLLNIALIEAAKMSFMKKGDKPSIL